MVELMWGPCGLTIGVNRRYRGGAVVGDEESERLAGQVARRGSVRVERLVRLELNRTTPKNSNDEFVAICRHSIF